MLKKVQALAKKMPILGLLGPRQSGKTTLAQMAFPKKKYISLENLDVRQAAHDDPKDFLAQFGKEGVIIDEVQHVPELFSYIQTIVDETQKPGQFILTGSQNFQLLESISQSLAGRITLFTLYPLSAQELEAQGMLSHSADAFIFHGGYPRLYQSKINPVDWYPDYITNYIERDVRKIVNVTNLKQFQDFLSLCAGRVGQLLNLSSLANDVGITHNTAKAWISVLEASYILKLLQPHYRNFNKRITKSPKLYFCDTGLLCSLLKIRDASQVATHPLKGSLFENMVVMELFKHYYNQHIQPSLYFWRDQTGNEVDCLIEKGDGLYPIEIKAGSTLNTDYLKGILHYNKLSKGKSGLLVYNGDLEIKQSGIQYTHWRNMLGCL